MVDKDKVIEGLQKALMDAQKRAETAEQSRDWWMGKCEELKAAAKAEEAAAMAAEASGE